MVEGEGPTNVIGDGRSRRDNDQIIGIIIMTSGFSLIKLFVTCNRIAALVVAIYEIYSNDVEIASLYAVIILSWRHKLTLKLK